MGVEIVPDMVIDDYPDIVSALGGIRVKPYVYERKADMEMEKVYHIISAFSANCHSPETSREFIHKDPV